MEVGNASDERARVAGALAAERGLLLLSSIEHRDVIAGQGTVGLELMAACLARPDIGEQLREREGLGLEVLVPIGGGAWRAAWPSR